MTHSDIDPVEQSRLKIIFNWKITALTVLLLPVLIKLGVWQLQSAEVKREIIAEQRQLSQKPPVDMDAIAAHIPKNHQPVTLTGSFSQEKWFLLDNKVQRGKVGYEVLVPFYTREGNWVLVNRGWVQGSAHRELLPALQQPLGDITIRAAVHVHRKNKVLMENVVTAEGWPKVVQSESIPVIAKALGHSLLPFQVRIEAADAAALAVDWPVVNSAPEKHLGYAIQWFVMAGMLILLYVGASSNIVNLLRRRFSRAKAQ